MSAGSAAPAAGGERPSRSPAPPGSVREAGVCERAGLAGTIPAIRIEGLGAGIEAGLTTRERNFRHRDRAADPGIAEAYAALEAFAHAFGGWVGFEQVHGASVLDASGSGGRLALEADGVVLRRAADSAAPRLLTVTVADCVPVYLAWPGGYGLLHAGWRGAAAGILEAGVRASGAPASRIRLHLGPSIGGCCYEVGSEVAESVYAGLGGPAAGERSGTLRRGGGGRWMLDLRAALAARAVGAGVDPALVTRSAHCTACDGSFHSFRASGERVARRLMLAFIGSRA